MLVFIRTTKQEQHFKILNFSLMKAGLFSFNNKKRLYDFQSCTEKQICLFTPPHLKILGLDLNSGLILGNGPEGAALCVERKRKPRGTAGERLAGPSKFNYRVMLEFGCKSL